MKTRHILALLWALACLPGMAYSAVFEIADGQHFALRQAINDANENGESDTILLAAGGRYNPGGDLGLPDITSPIRIYGQGATIDGANASGNRLFRVVDDGRLVVANLNIVNVNYTVDAPFYSGGVLDNQATTILRNVTIADTTITTNSGDVLGGAIASAGNMTLLNVTLSGNRIVGFGTGSALYNAGDALIVNATITNNRIKDQTVGAALDTTNAQSTSLQNTIVADNGLADCNGPTVSSGGNLDSDGSCEFDDSSDKPNTAPGLRALADNGGGILTHALQGNSPAVDAGVSGLCEPMDARGVPRANAGNENAGSRCDMGAHENWSAGPGFTEASTGSWFDPSQNGHGFMFEMLPDGRFLATWFVFDPAGNRDWIQALGSVQDDIARLTAYQVTGGSFPPNFDPDITMLRYWGTLSIVFTGCNVGAAAWHPDVLGYSAGGMPLARITNVAGTSCN